MKNIEWRGVLVLVLLLAVLDTGMWQAGLSKYSILANFALGLWAGDNGLLFKEKE